MGRSRQSKDINRNLEDEYSRVGRTTDQYTSGREAALGDSQQRSNDVYNRISVIINWAQLDNLGMYKDL
jgi:hypothetical protein